MLLMMMILHLYVDDDGVPVVVDDDDIPVATTNDDDVVC